MLITIENTGALGRRLTVEVPAQEVEVATQLKMNELSQKKQIPGFRSKSAIPAKILEQYFGPQARQEAVSKVIENTLPKALEQEQLKPAGKPRVERISNEENKDFKYTVSFEIFPEVDAIDFSKITAEKVEVSITDQDVEKTIERLRSQLADWKVVDREAKMGDRVVVDYTSTMDGKPYKSNQGKDVAVELGTKLFIEGFEQGLVGRKAGENLTLDLRFPENWRMEKLAGKAVQFKVKVKSVTEKHIAAFTLDFAKKIGSPSAEEPVIRKTIRETMEKQLAGIIQTRQRESVTNALLELISFPIPKALVEREASLLHEEMHQKMGDKGVMTCHHPELFEQAEKRVALGLVLNEVIKAEKLTPDEAKVKERVASLSKMFGNADFIESMYYESEELLSNVRHSVLLDQALDLVVSRANINIKHSTCDELFNRKS